MRDGRNTCAAIHSGLVALALTLVFAACGGSDSRPPQQSGAFPQDPEEWVCRDGTGATEEEIEAWCQAHPDRGEPLPRELRDPPPPADFMAYGTYNERLKRFMVDREYEARGWIADKHWRFSGPSTTPPDNFLNNKGPHFPLRVFYSPEVVDWLCNGRQGPLPDGATIVKTMFVLYDLLDVTVADDGCMDIADTTRPLPLPTPIRVPVFPLLWAPMIKASAASFDGWLWTLQAGDPLPPAPPGPQFPPPLLDRSAFTGGTFTDPITDDPAWYPTGGLLQDPSKIPNVVMLIPLAGQPYCLSCHATAASESTFASMDNILGKELRYKAFAGTPATEPTPTKSSFSPFPTPLPEPSRAFREFFDQIDGVSFAAVWDSRMPAETYDQQVISAHGGPQQFITAAQCNACHNATAQSPLLPKMVFVEDEAARSSRLRNLSPYGEWRVSPMGLAGRDPIFFAQLQSETNILPQRTACIETLCLHCHGAMGERQLAIDTPGQQDPACQALFGIAPPPQVPTGRPLRRAVLQQWPGEAPSDEQLYGALARDGVSCAVCHHVAETDLGEERTFTGNFVTGPADEIYGPYKDDTIVTKPMEQALGLTPKYGEQITSSDLCGSCHNVLLPVFDNDGQSVGAKYEQSTHLEWLNSESGRPGGRFQSCQDCHMPTEFAGNPLTFKISNSESNDQFPPTTNRLPDDEIQLTERGHYSRHSLHGLNVFLNQFFQQFPLLLGFQQIDFMSEQASFLDPPAPPLYQSFLMELPLFTGFESMLAMAENDTATIEIGRVQKTAAGQLRTAVTIGNLTGHYLPTGVGSRRIFVEFLVLDRDGATLWASGRTNDLGFILDGVSDRVLPSEQPLKFPDAPVQPHYERIESGNQVQIYQELVRDSDGALTTSFLRRVVPIKDNRIRPKGFDPQFFARSTSPYIQELAALPGGEAQDPYYVNPRLTGADKIEYHIALQPEALERADHVQVTLYYQSIPPFYLQQRFGDAAQGSGPQSDIERLYYLTGHLNLDEARSERGDAVLKGWKLRIAAAARRLQ